MNNYNDLPFFYYNNVTNGVLEDMENVPIRDYSIFNMGENLFDPSLLAECEGWGVYNSTNLISNLIANNTETINGITFVSSNGIIMVNGTAEDNVEYIIYSSERDTDKSLTLNGYYYLIGVPTGGNSTTYYLKLSVKATDDTDSTDLLAVPIVSFSTSSTALYTLSINIKKGQVCNNLKFSPQLYCKELTNYSLTNAIYVGSVNALYYTFNKNGIEINLPKNNKMLYFSYECMNDRADDNDTTYFVLKNKLSQHIKSLCIVNNQEWKKKEGFIFQTSYFETEKVQFRYSYNATVFLKNIQIREIDYSDCFYNSNDTTKNGITLTFQNSSYPYYFLATGTNEIENSSIDLFEYNLSENDYYVLEINDTQIQSGDYYLETTIDEKSINLKESGTQYFFLGGNKISIKLILENQEEYNLGIQLRLMKLSNLDEENYLNKKYKDSTNLLPYPYYSGQRKNSNLILTDFGDGSIKVSGSNMNVSNYINFTISDYVLNGQPMALDVGSIYTLSAFFDDNKSRNVKVYWEERESIQYRQQYSLFANLEENYITRKALYSKNSFFIRCLNTKITPSTIIPKMLKREKIGDNILPLIDYDKSKNLIPYPYTNTTKTIDGVTFTDNGDGSITVNGKATSSIDFTLCQFTTKKDVKYFISGCPTGGSSSTYYLHMRGFNQDVGKGATIGGVYDFTNTIDIVITEGTTVENLVFTPILKQAVETINKVGFFINDDNTITTHSNYTSFDTPVDFILYSNVNVDKTKTYFLEGCPEINKKDNRNRVNLFIELYKNNILINTFLDKGDGVDIDFKKYDCDTIKLGIRLDPNKDYHDDYTFEPKLTVISEIEDSEVIMEYPKTIKNGVSFINKEDGSVLVNGTANNNAIFYLFQDRTSFPPNLSIWNGDRFYGLIETENFPKSGCGVVFNTYNKNKVMITGFGQCNKNYITGGKLTSDMYGLGFYILVGNGNTVNNWLVKPKFERMYLKSYNNFIPLNTEINEDKNGISIIYNSDNTYTLNGTCTGDFEYKLNTTSFDIKGGHYYFFEGPYNNSSSTTYYLQLYYDNNGTEVSSLNIYKQGNVYIPTEDRKITRIMLIIKKDLILENEIIKPRFYEVYPPIGFIDRDKYLVTASKYSMQNLLGEGCRYYHGTGYRGNATINGVNILYQNDGTWLVNGTATDNVSFWAYYSKSNNDYKIPARGLTYTFSGCPLDENGNVSKPEDPWAQFTLSVYKNTIMQNSQIVNYVRDYGEGATFTTPEYLDYVYITATICLYKGKTYNNVIFKPQLELGTKITELKPFYEEPIEQICLNKPISPQFGINFKDNNLLPKVGNDGYLYTLNGITYNSKLGTIKIDGTSTESSSYFIIHSSNPILLEKGDYEVSCKFSQIDPSLMLEIEYIDNNGISHSVSVSNTYEKKIFSITEDNCYLSECKVYISEGNKIFNNVVLTPKIKRNYPQLNLNEGDNYVRWNANFDYNVNMEYYTNKNENKK